MAEDLGLLGTDQSVGLEATRTEIGASNRSRADPDDTKSLQGNVYVTAKALLALASGKMAAEDEAPPVEDMEVKPVSHDDSNVTDSIQNIKVPPNEAPSILSTRLISVRPTMWNPFYIV